MAGFLWAVIDRQTLKWSVKFTILTKLHLFRFWHIILKDFVCLKGTVWKFFTHCQDFFFSVVELEL